MTDVFLSIFPSVLLYLGGDLKVSEVLLLSIIYTPILRQERGISKASTHDKHALHRLQAGFEQLHQRRDQVRQAKVERQESQGDRQREADDDQVELRRHAPQDAQRGIGDEQGDDNG